MVRYYGLCANAHRGKVRKASRVPVALGMIGEEFPRLPSKGWAEMIRKVYEVDPMICPRCGGRMSGGAGNSCLVWPHFRLIRTVYRPPGCRAAES